MARARLIKPGFFTNDRLGELPAVTRILFAGLWTIADRDGRLEDRPTRIKAEVLPYDKGNVDRMLTALADAGFVLRYEVDGERYIQIQAFSKHQHPHMREPVSTIPRPCQAPGEHGASTGLAPDEPSESPAVTSTVTISGNPKPGAVSTEDPEPSGPYADPRFRERVETVMSRLPGKYQRDPLTRDEAEQLATDFDDLDAIMRAQETIRRTPGKLPFPQAIREILTPKPAEPTPRRESLTGNLPSAEELFPNAPWNRTQVAK